VRYLSLDWIDALTGRVAASEALRTLAEVHSIAVTQVVTGTPEGDVTYHFVVGSGSARFGAGPADDEDVRLVQDHETAVGVATGTLNAQEVFIGGRIRVSGDVQKLLANEPVFAALDAVFEDVRPDTTY
jgi:putative sterol carrier protein